MGVPFRLCFWSSFRGGVFGGLIVKVLVVGVGKLDYPGRI